MNKTVKTLLVVSSLALAGAFAQQTPAPQPAPAQPMQRMMFRGLGGGNLYYAAAQFLGQGLPALTAHQGVGVFLAQLHPRLVEGIDVPELTQEGGLPHQVL